MLLRLPALVCVVLALCCFGIARAEVPISEATREIQAGVHGCADASGTYVVVWDSGADPQRGDARVLARRLDRNGTALGPEIAVSTAADGQHDPFVACQADGSFLVVWTDDAAGQVAGRFFDAQGAPLVAPFAVNEIAAANVASVGACALAGGDYLTAWQSVPHPGRLFVRRFATSGAVSGEVPVDGGGAVASGKLACGASGEIVVAWRDTTNAVDRGQRLDAAPALLGASFTIDTAPDPGADVLDVAVTPDGRLVAQWISGDGTAKGRRYLLGLSNGAPQAASFTLQQHPIADRVAPPAVASGDAIFSVAEHVLHTVDGVPLGWDAEIDGRRMVLASPREKRTPATVVVGANDEILVVLSQVGGASQLFGRLFDVQPFTCSTVPLSGCLEPARATFSISDPAGTERDRTVWKAPKVTGGPSAYQVISHHRLCTYDYTSGVPHLVQSIWTRVVDECGLHHDTPCWKVTRRGGLRHSLGSSFTVGVDATRASFVNKDWVFLPGPVSANRYFDKQPMVTVQLVNGRGECWSTDFPVGVDNTATGFRAAR